ncbi:MAG: sucrase ferredoxin [Chloroflexota bacterium]
MNNQINLDEFCCQASQSNGEQICGTAAQVHVWFALEYVEPWGVKAVPESDLSTKIKDYLMGLGGAYPHTRVQFIKRDAAEIRTQKAANFPSVDSSATLFVGVAKSETSQPALYRFALTTYDELLALDLGGVIAGDSQYDANRYDEPIFLVCTNGKRDRCCAKWGLPVYDAMADYAGENVWQTTHIGGHRFAPTLVCLPHGIVYGRVGLDDVQPIVDASRQNEMIDLSYYRGNGTYPSVAQAAEYFLRMKTGNLTLGEYALGEVRNGEVTDDDAQNPVWRVGFTTVNGANERYEIKLARVQSAFATIGSCEKPATPVPQYELLEIATA